MKLLLKDSNEAFMEKLDADSEKLDKVYDQVSVREYITNCWFYNDLGNEDYKEMIFSSERGCALLKAVSHYTFPEYIQGCGVWPPGSIKPSSR